MAIRVLILQSDENSAKTLARFFSERGDEVWLPSSPQEAIQVLDQSRPELALVDLHLPESSWMLFLRHYRRACPQGRVIMTNKYPDFQHELMAKEQGAQVFLRQPFTNQWIQAALNRLYAAPTAVEVDTGPRQPRVSVPVRIKITVPYVILALLFALAGAYVVSRLVFESVEQRFQAQLVETGKQNSDWMVQEEDRLLGTLRMVANTQGVLDAVSNGDAEALRELVLPLAVNSREDAIEILDATGRSVLSLRHTPGGNLEDYTYARSETIYRDWDYVQYVLQRRNEQGLDKNAGLSRTPWGDVFYVSGPLNAPDGTLAGVVLVGRYLPSLVRLMGEDTLAEVTLYDRTGVPLASTMLAAGASGQTVPAETLQKVLAQQDQSSQMRTLQVASNEYGEILGPWEVRDGADLGIMGVALGQLYLVQANQVTRAEIFVLVSGAFLLVIVVGVSLANQITRPLLRMVKASSEIAQGNLEVKVDSRGNDEVAVLAHTFNQMIAGLQEGSIYRDLLGRTVSPEVREELRQTFTTGNVRLEGQAAMATVMISDIRGFTSLSEKVDPATVFDWLNEYFAELVPIITANNGVVNKFDGDAMLAFFGILPKTLSPEQSAYFACRAAVEILEAIERLNVRRVERGEPPLATGIGLNTGLVTAGGLGTSDRLHYTIIGDTVNTAQRVEALTRELINISGVVISESTYQALEDHYEEFQIDPLGAYVVKGKADRLMVYRLLPVNRYEAVVPGEVLV